MLDCPDGKYGVNCSSDCGHCRDNADCDSVSGHCTDQCESGWTGDTCTTGEHNRHLFCQLKDVELADVCVCVFFLKTVPLGYLQCAQKEHSVKVVQEAVVIVPMVTYVTT